MAFGGGAVAAGVQVTRFSLSPGPAAAASASSRSGSSRRRPSPVKMPTSASKASSSARPALAPSAMPACSSTPSSSLIFFSASVSSARGHAAVPGQRQPRGLLLPQMDAGPPRRCRACDGRSTAAFSLSGCLSSQSRSMLKPRGAPQFGQPASGHGGGRRQRRLQRRQAQPPNRSTSRVTTASAFLALDAAIITSPAPRSNHIAGAGALGKGARRQLRARSAPSARAHCPLGRRPVSASMRSSRASSCCFTTPPGTGRARCTAPG